MVRKFSVLIIFVSIFSLLVACGYNMNNFPKGEFLAEYTSPDEKYTINIYLCNGNATVDFSIRGELVDNATSDSRNIYWSYHESEAVVVWVNESTVKINGHILNILTDTYDFRTE